MACPKGCNCEEDIKAAKPGTVVPVCDDFAHGRLQKDSTCFTTKDSGERQEFSTGMVRDSGAKMLRPDLIDQEMIRRWAELMGRGAIKYGERNWEKAATQEELDRFRASAYRHFFQWFNNLNTEEDHASAILFNVAGAEMVIKKLQGNSK